MRQAPQDMHPEVIKAEIRIACGSMAELSRQSGYDADTLRKALAQPYPAAETIIANALKKRPQDIWPSRYLPDGTPRVHCRPSANVSTASAGGNVKVMGRA